MTKADAVELLRLFMRDMHGSADFHFYDKVMPTVEKYAEQFVRPEAKSPASRSRAALPENIRKTLEESNIPVEVATAIADLCEGKIARPEEERVPMSYRAFSSPDAFASYCINKGALQDRTEWAVAYELWLRALGQSLDAASNEVQK